MREKGTASYSGNFEVQKAAPLDARGKAATVADLILASTWTANDGLIYVFKGLSTVVTDDPTPSKNGIWWLSALPYSDPTNWKQIAGSTGGGGHTIKDATTTLAQRVGLKFIGNVTVTDDSIEDNTVIEIKNPTYTKSDTAPLNPQPEDRWLDTNPARTPVEYIWFVDEDLEGYWVNWGGISSIPVTELNADKIITDTTLYTENLGPLDTNLQLISNKVDKLPVWKLDANPWSFSESTVYLKSHLFRDFGSLPVSIQINIYIEEIPDSNTPFLSEYMFKFVYGSGGSFVYPPGITLATNNPTLVNGLTYEANIVRGKLIYKNV